MKRKSTPGRWFIRVRGSYLPISWKGWLLYIPYTAYIVGVLLYALNSRLSIGTTLFVVIPNWVTALAVMTWIAGRTSH